MVGIPPRKIANFGMVDFIALLTLWQLMEYKVYIAKIQLYAHLLYFHPWRMNNMIQHVVFVDVHPI